MGQDTRLNIILSANNAEATRALEATNKQVQAFSEVVTSSNTRMAKSNKELYETYAVGKEAIEQFLDLFRGGEEGLEKMAQSSSKVLNSISKITTAKPWNELVENVLGGDKALTKLKKTYEELEKAQKTIPTATKDMALLKKEIEAIEKAAGESKLLIKFGETLSKITGGNTGEGVVKLGQNWQKTANSIVDGANKFAHITEFAEILGRMTYGAYQFVDAMGEVPNKIGEAAGAAEEFVGVLEQNPFIKAAAEIESYEIRLKSLLGSQEAATKALKFMHEEAAEGGFETASMIEAGQVIKEFQLDIEETIPLVEKLAAGTGKELPQAAVALGNAFSGISGGFTQLQRTFRLTKDQLIQVGAATNDYNEITNETTVDILKNQKAIEKLINTKYADVVKEQAETIKGSFTNFHEAIERLEEGVGNVFKKPVVEIVNKITEVVQKASSVIVPLMEYMQKQGIDLFSPVTFGAKVLVGTLDRVATAAVAVKDTFEGISNTVKPIAAGLVAMGGAAVGFTAALAPLIKITLEFYLLYKGVSLLSIGLVGLAARAAAAAEGIALIGPATAAVAGGTRMLVGGIAAMATSSSNLTKSLLFMNAAAIGIGATLAGFAVAWSLVNNEVKKTAEAQKNYTEVMEMTVASGKNYRDFLGMTASQVKIFSETVKQHQKSIEEANESYEKTTSTLQEMGDTLEIEKQRQINTGKIGIGIAKSLEEHAKIEKEYAEAKLVRDEKIAEAQRKINKEVQAYEALLGRNQEALESSGMSSEQAQLAIESLNEELALAERRYKDLTNAAMEMSAAIANGQGVDSDTVDKTNKEVGEAKKQREEMIKLRDQQLQDLIDYKNQQQAIEAKALGDSKSVIEDAMKVEKSYEKLQRDIASGNIENRQEEADRTNAILQKSTEDRRRLEQQLAVQQKRLDTANKEKAPEGDKAAEEALAEKRKLLEQQLKVSQDLYQAMLAIEKTTSSQMISINVGAAEERLQKKKTLLDHEMSMGRASVEDQIQLQKDWAAKEKELGDKRLGDRAEVAKQIEEEEKRIAISRELGSGRPDTQLNILKTKLTALDGFNKAMKEKLAQSDRDVELMTRQNLQNIQKIQIDADASDKVARSARIEDLHSENELGKYRLEYLKEEYELTARNFEQERQGAMALHEIEQANIGDAELKAANNKKFAAEMDDLTHREMQSLREVKKYYQEIQAAAKEAEIAQIESAKGVLASKQSVLEDKYSRGYDNSKEIEANRKAQEKMSEDEIRINEKTQLQKLEEDQKTARELRELYAAEQIKEIEETRQAEIAKLNIKIQTATVASTFMEKLGLKPVSAIVDAEKEARQQILEINKSSAAQVEQINTDLAATNANTEEALAKKVKDIKTVADNQIANNRRASLLEDERRQIESASRIAGIRVQKDQEALSQIELNRLQMEENIRSGKSSAVNAFQAEAELSAQVYENQKKILKDTLQEALTHKNIEESRRAQIAYAQGIARLEVDYAKQKRVEEATERSARADSAAKDLAEARAALDFKIEAGQLQVTAIRAAQMEKQALLESLDAQKKIILAKADEAIAQDNGINKERIQKDARNQINGAVRDTIKLIQQSNQKMQDGNSELDKAVNKYNKIKQALDDIKGNKEEEDEDLKPKETEENSVGGFSETMREDRLKMKLKKAQADIDKATKDSFKKAALEYEAYAASHGTSIEEAAKVLSAPAGPMGKLTETMVALTEAVKNQTDSLNGNGATGAGGGAGAGGGSGSNGASDTDPRNMPPSLREELGLPDTSSPQGIARARFEISRADRMRMGGRTGPATPDWGEGEYKISREDRMRMGNRKGPATPDWGEGPYTISPEDRVRMRNRDHSYNRGYQEEAGEWGQGSAADAMAKDKAKQDAKNKPVAVAKSGKDKESGPKDFGPKPFGDEAKNKPEASSDQTYLAQIAAGVSALVQMAGNMKGGGAPTPAPDKKKTANGGQGPGANPKNYDKNGKANEDFSPYETALNFNRRMPGQFTS